MEPGECDFPFYEGDLAELLLALFSSTRNFDVKRKSIIRRGGKKSWRFCFYGRKRVHPVVATCKVTGGG